MNQFYTRRGERVMRPEYGTIIYDVLMEPNIPEVEEIIKEDIEKIIESDPRVRLSDINIIVGDHSIQAEVKIEYVMLDSTETLYLDYVSQDEV